MTSSVDRWAELRDREALSEPLSEQERKEAESLELSDPLVRAQAAPLRELSRMLERASLERPTAEDRDMVDRVLRSVRVTTGRAMPEAIDADAEMERAVDPEGPRWVRPTAIAVSILLPAAAALSLIFYEPKPPANKGPVTTQLSAPTLAPTVIELAHARTAPRGQRLMRAGRMLPSNTDLVEGDRVESGVSPGCLVVDPGVNVCLAANSEVKVASLSRAARNLEVLRGHAIAHLDKQAPGDGFALSAAGVSAQATGTIYSLERVSDDAVQVRVLEGHVKVLGTAQTRELTALQTVRYRAAAPEGEVEPLLVVHQTRMWDLLSTRPSGADAAAKAQPAEEPSAEPSETPPTTEPVLPSATKVPVPEKPAAADAKELLRKAWEQLKAKQWAAAAETYAVILKDAPKSEEAHVVLVRFGDLQLDRLNQPGQALQSYERYLREGGGPLEAEARYGRIQALSRLGRAGAERAAIEEFLAKHPTSLKADALRERLLTLPR